MVSVENPIELGESRAHHTIVLSDIHLSEAEQTDPRRPLWKRFKHPSLFVDPEFKAFLEWVKGALHSETPIELILNGDIFDFDSVMALPPGFKTTLLERLRGMAPEEAKSLFKIGLILNDHLVWVEALRTFVEAGHRLVIVIGNHDIELHWPSVQKVVLDALDPSGTHRKSMRFTEWFYLSSGDTLIEHGNQYDSYCMCSNPMHPLVSIGGRTFVRLPFGNLAGKYMLNGMGLMNPHVDDSYIKSSLKEYVIFYYNYVMKTQPLMMWSWFWSAIATGAVYLTEGLLPALRDPLMTDARVSEIARKANATPALVWSLRELHAHPAVYNPLKILRELWLDRAIILGLIVAGSFQFFSTLNVFVSVSVLWFIIPLLLLFPLLIFYARSIKSELDETQTMSLQMAPLSASLAKVKRVVHGHLHREAHGHFQGVEYLNPGTWSPAFKDVECKQLMGRKCFVWIKPPESGGNRTAELYEWRGNQAIFIPADQKKA